MIYEKPRDIRYVDMAIWIDENAYTGTCNQETLYEYLFHLARMVARKRRLFEKSSEFDDFAVYAASRYFFRLMDKRQFEIDEDGNPRMPKIKSILNYIKKTVYPVKVDFLDEMHKSDRVGENSEESELALHNILQESINGINVAEFDVYLNDVAKTVREYFSRIPKKLKSAEWQNIYISCLLSFISSITLRKGFVKNVSHFINESRLKPETLEKMYRLEREDGVILFHLPESMRGYVTVLVNGMRKAIAEDLSSILHENIGMDTMSKELLVQSLIDNVGDEQCE